MRFLMKPITAALALKFEIVNGGLEMPNYGGIKVLRHISTYLIPS